MRGEIFYLILPMFTCISYYIAERHIRVPKLPARPPCYKGLSGTHLYTQANKWTKWAFRMSASKF